MMLTKSALSSQHWFHSLVVSISSLILCYSATGGELIQTLLLAVPLAIVFAVSGYVGGLLALCASLAGITGVYALMNLISPQAPIPPALTYIAVSLVAIAIAVSWRRSRPEPTNTGSLETLPLAVVPLLIALISGYLVFKWTRFTDLEFLSALAGSEDNAAWIKGTRTVVSGEMTTGFLTHYTNSPVTGSTLGFVSDVYWLSRSDTPEYLLALRSLRSAYSMVVSLTAIAAGVWVTVVSTREQSRRWLGLVASLVVAMAILGASLFLFMGVGFFSFINGVLFALVVAIGFEIVYSQPRFSRQSEAVLTLVVCGFGGAWMGVVPLAAVLVIVVVTTPGSKGRWIGRFGFDQARNLVAILLALSTLLWTWAVSMGRHGVELIGATGTVPIVDTAWLPLIFAVIVLLVSPATECVAARRRVFHLSLAVYATMIWLMSMVRYAEPRYSAFKIVLLLSLVAMAGLGVTLVERASKQGWPLVLSGLALVVLWSSVVHESHSGFRGLGRPNVTGTVQSEILEILSQDPNARIVCLHQDPEQRIAAYLCSRLATAFSPGWSRALNVWTSAILNSDISPNGIEVPRADHVGTGLLTRFREESTESNLVVILIGGNEGEGVKKDLGPDFWWVPELNWSEIQVRYL